MADRAARRVDDSFRVLAVCASAMFGSTEPSIVFMPQTRIAHWCKFSSEASFKARCWLVTNPGRP